MSKTEKPARPRAGGSYVRHADTGKLKRTEFTKQPDTDKPLAAALPDAKDTEQAKSAGPGSDVTGGEGKEG